MRGMTADATGRDLPGDCAAGVQHALHAHRAEQHAGKSTATTMAQYQHIHLGGHVDQHARGRPRRDHDVYRRLRGVACQRIFDHAPGLFLEIDLNRRLRRCHRLSAPVHRVLREVGGHDAQSRTPPVGLDHRVLQSSP
jgi:hypothetical protein